MRHVERHRLPTTSGLLWLLSACATPVQVTEVASGNGPAVFDLQGDSLVGLQAVADKACPHGHTVLRHWQGGQTTAPTANMADRAWFQVQHLVGETSSRAQLVVQCLPASADTPSTAPGPGSADADAPKNP